MSMENLTGSCTIAAAEPDAEPRQEPCYVHQQQDAEDTVPCPGNQSLLNALLRFMGFDIPVPEQPEDYSTQIKIKPKNGYTNLNIAFSDNITTAGGQIKQTDNTCSVSIAIGDFVEAEGGGYVDIAAKLELVETDIVTGLRWVGDVYDAQLSQLLPKPGFTLDKDRRLPLSQPVSGELVVKVSETSHVFDIKVSPREDGGENAYQSSLIVQPEGCEGQPTRYEIKVPECYRNGWLDKYGWPGDGTGGDGTGGDGAGDVTIYHPPPEFVDPVDAEDQYCLCGNHKLLGRSPRSREESDISNICLGGPCDQITEPDCVPDDRDEGDDYC